MKNILLYLSKRNKDYFINIIILFKMIFRKKDGTLVEIKRYDYKNDIIYYQKIMELYKLNLNNNPPELNNNDKFYINSIDRILHKL
jgi:hypothetical protein